MGGEKRESAAFGVIEEDQSNSAGGGWSGSFRET